MTVKKMITYREVWMGLAMLWIMLFHSLISFPFSFLKYAKYLGYSGVDIFLFAAGIGNYYSYLRDESPLDFLKRRIRRLAPTYIPFISLWCIAEVIWGGLSPRFIVGNLLGIQGFSSSGKYFNWYLTGIAICYLLTPYFATFVKRNNLKNNCVFAAVLVMISTAFWDDRRLIISFARLPIYFIGMICAKWDDQPIVRKHTLLGALLCCIGFALLAFARKYQTEHLWSYGYLWYPFIIITPFLCYVISLVSQRIEKNRILSAVLAAVKSVGAHSFELYLVHIPIFGIVESVTQKYEFLNHNFIWVASFAIVFPCAYVLKCIGNGIKSKLEKRISPNPVPH